MKARLQDFLAAFRSLGLESKPVIAHSSLSAFGYFPGNAEGLIGVLLAVFETLIMPTFTYRTMIVPMTGPPNNGISYGSKADANRMAEFFFSKMPADPMMGIVAETLRKHSRAKRSTHPILSFSGINADEVLQAQTMDDPLAPIAALEKKGGWVLLMGVDHKVNTSIHYAEKMAGRKQFVRWSLTPTGVRECPGFPGCSAGFQSVAKDVEQCSRHVKVGNAIVQAIPIKSLSRVVVSRIKNDPLALLCQQEDCERCNAVMDWVIKESWDKGRREKVLG